MHARTMAVPNRSCQSQLRRVRRRSSSVDVPKVRLLIVSYSGSARHVADHNHDQNRDNRNEHAEVLKIDIIDNPQKRSRGVAVRDCPCRIRIPEQAQRDRRVHEHAEEAEGEAHDHGPQAAFGVEALPKDAEEKDDKDRRRQVALHRLKIVVQAARSLNDRNPQSGQ